MCSCQHFSKHWISKQHNKTAQPKADKYPTENSSSFRRCFSVVLQLQKGAYHENSHAVYLHNK